MPAADTDQWDARYRDADAAAAQPIRLLQAFSHLLPAQGSALEIACGLGANARFLAAAGLAVTAWDSSAQAIDKLAAAASGLPLTAQVRDVVREPPPPASFDLIVVSRFLERALCPAIAAALKPGGLLFYQTFVRDKDPAIGPRNPAFLLERNELLRLFAGLELIAYREEGRLGDTRRGWREEAHLIARRPA